MPTNFYILSFYLYFFSAAFDKFIIANYEFYGLDLKVEVNSLCPSPSYEFV